MTSAPLSSQEYLEQLRAQRLARQNQTQPVQPTPMSDPASTQSQPVASVAEPTTSTPTPETTESAPVPETDATDEFGQAPMAADLFPDVPRPQPEQVVLTWTAASRPFKKRNRRYYTTVGLIVFLISLILFFAGQMIPIAVVISVGFLAYVLASVPPDDIELKLTTYGIRIEEQLYYWEELGRFWFTTKFDQPLLHVEIGRFPFRLTLLVQQTTPEELRDILSQVLLEEQPQPTFFEQAADWLQSKLPLDTD